MNYIVALLLLFLSEEETFWVMVVIIEHTLKDYYSQVSRRRESFLGSARDHPPFYECDATLTILPRRHCCDAPHCALMAAAPLTARGCRA